MPSAIQGPGATQEAIAQRPVESSEQADAPTAGSGRTLFSELLVSSRRHWRLVASIWFGATAVSVGVALVLTPYYSSVGMVQVSSKDGLGAANPVAELFSGSGSEVQTELEVIRSRELLLSAAHSVKLGVKDPEKNVKFSSDVMASLSGKRLDDPQMIQIRDALDYARIPDERGVGSLLRLRVLSDTEFELDVMEDSTVLRSIPGRVGKEIRSDAFLLQFNRRPLDVGASKLIWIEHDGLLLEEVKKGLSLRALGPERKPTNLVRVSFTQPSREMAQKFVQATMDRYLEQSLDWQSLRASRSADFLTEQIDDIKQRLESDEESLREFSEKEQAAGLEIQAKVTVEESARLRTESSKIEMKLKILENARKRLRQGIESGAMASLTATFVEDPVLLGAVAQLTNKETQRGLLRASYNDNHPLVVRVNREIEEEKRTLLKILATASRNLRSQRKELKQGADELDKQLTGFPYKELELARRARDLEVSQRLYAFLLEKKHEAEIVKASTTTDKRVIDNASFPHRPAGPRRSKIVLMGLFGGLLAGILGAFQLRFFQRRVDSVERIQEMLEYPVYGSIPALETGQELSQKVKGVDRRVHVHPDSLWKDQHAPVTEAFRSLCVNVGMIPKTPGRARVVQITSSETREGKSTVLSNLAVALRRSGASVLVIDLDLRKPTQHRIWSCPRNPGYTDLIASGCSEPEALDFFKMVGNEGIKLLSAGSKAPETLTALMHPSFETMLEGFAQRFDYVLVDSPPFFVADSSVIAKFVDLLLVVARPGAVERSSLQNTAHRVARCDVPKGLVLNAVEGRHHDAKYGGGSYGYGYSYTGYEYQVYASDSEQEAA